MKKFELNVVNFNNEDVIATSGDTSDEVLLSFLAHGGHGHWYLGDVNERTAETNEKALPAGTLIDLGFGEPYTLGQNTSGCTIAGRMEDGDGISYKGLFTYDEDHNKYTWVREVE